MKLVNEDIITVAVEAEAVVVEAVDAEAEEVVIRKNN